MTEKNEKTVKTGELTVRSMGREEAFNLLERIKAKALEEAEKGGALRVAEETRKRLEQEEREMNRRELLRQQAAELLAQEGEQA